MSRGTRRFISPYFHVGNEIDTPVLLINNRESEFKKAIVDFKMEDVVISSDMKNELNDNIVPENKSKLKSGLISVVSGQIPGGNVIPYGKFIENIMENKPWYAYGNYVGPNWSAGKRQSSVIDNNVAAIDDYDLTALRHDAVYAKNGDKQYADIVFARSNLGKF